MMRPVKTTGSPRYTGISPAVLVLATMIAGATAPWASDALCAQTDPYLFYADSPDIIAEAKAICRRCPVRHPCLATALNTGEEHGVWGGLDRDERRRLLRRQTQRPRATKGTA